MDIVKERGLDLEEDLVIDLIACDLATERLETTNDKETLSKLRTAKISLMEQLIPKLSRFLIDSWQQDRGGLQSNQ